MAYAHAISELDPQPQRPARYFGGECLRAVQYPGARLAEVRYGTMRVCRRHTHERAFFSLLLSGSYTENFAGGGLASDPRHAAFHAPDTVHRDRIDAAGTRIFIVELLEDDTHLREQQPAICIPEVSWLTRRLHQHFTRGTLDAALLEGTLLEMKSPAEGCAERSRPQWLGRVVDLLHSEFRRPISLQEIARDIGIHPAYLSRCFRKNYAVCVGDYVNRLRVRYAQQQLASTDATLATIAHECGFADQPHFTRVFRAQLGTTPGAFRLRS